MKSKRAAKFNAAERKCFCCVTQTTDRSVDSSPGFWHRDPSLGDDSSATEKHEGVSLSQTNIQFLWMWASDVLNAFMVANSLHTNTISRRQIRSCSTSWGFCFPFHLHVSLYLALTHTRSVRRNDRDGPGFFPPLVIWLWAEHWATGHNHESARCFCILSYLLV